MNERMGFLSKKTIFIFFKNFNKNFYLEIKLI